MAARTFTTAGVNNLWSNAANWDGGLTIPAEDDSVTIPTGQTCEYDYNSAYTTGIAGITITGTGKLSLTRTAGTYRLFMKAATTIAGTGTFDCGASALDPIPFTAKHTITGGAGWYINGASGLTMTVYAAEPSIKTILLSGDEAIGQTILSVGTDITSDIWADGDIIRIDDINKAQESEERTIAIGGRAAGTITVTAGLTAAKSTGAVVSLVTRNVKFIGTATSNLLISFASGKLTIAGGQYTNTATYMINGCTGMIISGGVFHGANRFIYNCTNVTISGGVFTGGVAYAIYANGGEISGGSYSGNATVFSGCTGITISGGTYKGNTQAVYSCTGITISGGTYSGNAHAVFACIGVTITGGTFTSNTNGIYQTTASIKGASYSSNTQDINLSPVTCFNTLFSSTENTGYTSLSKETYSESIDHDQTLGKFAAWTKGGVTASATTPVPTGYTTSYIITLADASNEGFWQREYTVGAGASVNITMNLRKSASMVYLPRVVIFNKASTDPFAGGAGIHTFTMTDSVDTFEAETYTYYNSTANDVTLVIRFQGKNASGTVTTTLLVEQINVDLTTLINNLAVVDTNVDAIKAKTDNLPTDPADESLLEAAISAISPVTATVEGTITIQQALRILLAAMAGKASGGGTTAVKFRDTSDSKDRITATVDANGNRTVVTLDPS